MFFETSHVSSYNSTKKKVPSGLNTILQCGNLHSLENNTRLLLLIPVPVVETKFVAPAHLVPLDVITQLFTRGLKHELGGKLMEDGLAK